MRAHVHTDKKAWVANKHYAAPEQRRKGAKVDHRADIFALGLILNEMYIGDPPFGSNHQRIENVDPRYKYLDELVDKMISRNPDDRPSVAAILEILESDPPLRPKPPARPKTDRSRINKRARKVLANS